MALMKVRLTNAVDGPRQWNFFTGLLGAAITLRGSFTTDPELLSDETQPKKQQGPILILDSAFLDDWAPLTFMQLHYHPENRFLNITYYLEARCY